ncbi:MAG: hypothetical protein M3Y54_14060, partial [Bacteroidota bacterium]|nr:hypothetical protein [Bacteroidota bacterium]
MKFSVKTLFVAVAVAFAATACETKTTDTTVATDGNTAVVVTDTTMTPMSGEEMGAKMDAAGNKM